MGGIRSEKGLNNDRSDDDEGGFETAPSPWSDGLGPQISPYLDDLLSDGRDRSGRHNIDRIGSRLKKRLEAGDIGEEDFNRYTSILERIREE